MHMCVIMIYGVGSRVVASSSSYPILSYPMESEHKPSSSSSPSPSPSPTQAHPETMDFLSRTWCNFALQAFQPHLLHGDDDLINKLKLQDSVDECHPDPYPYPYPDPDPDPSLKKSIRINEEDMDRILPPWKSSDVKSWLWMQQAMHPELNYNGYSYYFKKKWLHRKLISPIMKWLKDINQRSKEGKRLQRAEVHAAVSVAGLAAALAAIAAKNSSSDIDACAVASAAALVAKQCARVAESMGANKQQLHTAITSATTTGTSAGDDDHILTLTAAATTSLRGAAALKVREGCNNSNLNHQAPVIEDNNDYTFSFGKCRLLLAKGAKLNVETPDGSCGLMFVSVACNREAKVVLTTKKPDLFNVFSRPKKSVVLDLKAELYSAETDDISYVIILTTNNGMIKLDMMDDYRGYKAWSTTITHMLMLST